ncbi:thiamine pyrophosphate-dependent dehydrogenase E1 component subunit alpha [Amycolatopsis sp. 195334CR]|uniref:thiamine pyrophosphate-dependent dehydrogenase E1 component subunit alpha n=1 Tax=Amycolatopsis sp. 195334CR TaxID=2814588 RepID=UPI001A8FFBCE|nr:thiamine pyrophosphate-dependent dehydrogenase E1 component subunit alpha [Amycolatopsis sp. 195334CR]MBN6040998.1 thiamine pyrophosphate-dependent dehydrogenase E1 component subunit alpha [Amycolatopsis sp. 195334CR]
MTLADAATAVQRRDLPLYETMLRIRAFEETALELQRRGEVPGALHPATGHEAIAAGVCAHLGPADHVVSYYRCHGHALAVGVDPAAMFAELLGRATGLNKGKGGSMHLADRSHRFLGGNSIVGANVGIAAGMAAALRIRQEPGAVVVFFGDGAVGAGVVLETLRIAAHQRLPLLFVCENNGYQDRTRSELVSGIAPGAVAAGLGVPSTSVDGNDARAVADAAGALLPIVREERTARFLDAATYLRDFHCQFGPEPPGEYRPVDEVRRWRARDPLSRADFDLTEPRRRAVDEMRLAAAHALAQPEPSVNTVDDDLTAARW